MRIKLAFSVLGALALAYLISDYGLATLWNDLQLAGWGAGVLILTFVPTLLCYSLAWSFCTRVEKKINPFERVGLFTGMSAASIAFNNLTPFLKIAGEPAKYLMLRPLVSKNEAIRSVIVYNVVHILGTLGAFVLAAFWIPIFFDVSSLFAKLSFGLGASLLLFLSGAYFFPFPKRTRRYRKLIIPFRWSRHQTIRFLRRSPGAFWASIGLEIFARYIEGLTFFVAFALVGNPLGFMECAFLDVARTLADVAFFFVPFQMGSREGSVWFFLEEVFRLSPNGYLTAVFMMRFVEIAWVGLGYVFWLYWQRKPVPSPPLNPPGACQESL